MNKEMRKLAGRMANWINRIESEMCADGVREFSVQSAAAIARKYADEEQRMYRQIEFKRKRQQLKSGDSEVEED